ncbi:MAG: hypothetical protein ABFD83_03555 [Armatimonadota bacterium]
MRYVCVVLLILLMLLFCVAAANAAPPGEVLYDVSSFFDIFAEMPCSSNPSGTATIDFQSNLGGGYTMQMTQMNLAQSETAVVLRTSPISTGQWPAIMAPDSFFDVFLEIYTPGGVMHTNDPIHYSFAPDSFFDIFLECSYKPGSYLNLYNAQDQYVGYIKSSTLSMIAVPEPSCIAILLSGLVTFAAFKKRSAGS